MIFVLSVTARTQIIPKLRARTETYLHRNVSDQTKFLRLTLTYKLRVCFKI